jgi:mono/diheme cytochrome c family protein
MQLHKITIASGLALALSFSSAFAGSSKPAVSFGTAITEAGIAAWDIDIQTATGKGLPSGSGSVAEGKALFQMQCVSCHGVDAAGGSQYGSMVGGKRPLTGGGYPYAPILFDYIRRAMPMNAPQSLSNDEVYALTAYIYALNEFIPQDAVLDAGSLASIQMPAHVRDGFIVDDRPDTAATRCMEDC